MEKNSFRSSSGSIIELHCPNFKNDIKYIFCKKKKRIPTTTLINFSNEIAALFQSEDPTAYFTPFRVVAGVRKEATGKLWEHYNYMKKVLREQGVLAESSISQLKELQQQTVTLDGSHIMIFVLRFCGFVGLISYVSYRIRESKVEVAGD